MAEGDGSSRNFRSAYYEKLGFCGNEEKNILDLLIASSPFDLEKLNDLCERFDLDRRCVEAWKVLLGVECGRKSPFDDFANVRQIRVEHFQSLKHHLEVLLRHNSAINHRLKTCSTNLETKPSDNHDGSQVSLKGEANLDVSIDERSELFENERTSSPKSSALDNNIGFVSPLSNGKAAQGTSNTNLSEDIETNPGRQITLMYLLEAGRLDSDIDTQLDSDYCRKLSAMASFFVNVSSDLQEAFFLFRNFIRKLEEDLRNR